MTRQPMQSESTARDTRDVEYSRRTVLGSASWATLQQVVAMGSTAVSGIILARVLTVADFGLFSYATALASMGMVVMTAGLSGLAIKALVKDRAHESRTMTVLVATRELAAFLAYGVLIFVSLSSGDVDAIYATVIASLVLFARAFDATELWFQSRAESKKSAPVRIIVVLVMLAVRIVCALAGADVLTFLLLYLAESLLITIGLFIRYWKDRDSPRFGRFDWLTAKTLIASSWILLLSGVAAQVNSRGDVIVIQAIVGSEAVGIYSAAARLSELFYFLPVVFMTATFPRLLQIREKAGSSSPRYRRELQRSYDRACWGGMAIAALIFVMGPWAIGFLYGDRYASAGAVLQVHVLALPFVFMAAVFSKWIIAEHLLVASLTRHILGAVLNLGLNFLLIPEYGLIGAAYATLLSYFVASYFSCFASRATWPAGVQMTLALVWPARILFGAVRSVFGRKRKNV